MTELLQILNEDFEGLDPRYATIWTTHPDPEERIEASRANLVSVAGKSRDPRAFDQVVRPLRALTVRDYIQDDYPYTAIAVAEKFIERYPNDLDYYMALGDALSVLGPRPAVMPDEFSKRDARRNLRARILRTRDQRMDRLLESPEGVAALAENLRHARETYQGILDRNPQYFAAYRGLGEVYEAEGNDRYAARAYLTYIQEVPDAKDRQVVVGRLTGIRNRLLEEETDNE
jgi:tetratricopeptide (TPR) repeat protein